jgi:hypothetical protein
LLFDPRPKARGEDLYDFDAELGKLLRALGEPVVLVSGLRRTGKTSLVLTALNESARKAHSSKAGWQHWRCQCRAPRAVSKNDHASRVVG